MTKGCRLPLQLNWWEPLNEGEFGNLKMGQQLYEAEAKEFVHNSQLGKTDEKFVKHIIKDGTFNDKITLMTQYILESPLHNLSRFRDLLEMAQKKSRDQAVRALEALVTLFASQGKQSILPKRALRVYRACLEIRPTEEQIIQAYFEDKLREIFFELLQCLEVWLKDNVQNTKIRGLTFLYSLCCYTSEHSENILRLIANKLGDPDKKVSSQAGYVLVSLASKKVELKPFIVKITSMQLTKSNDVKCKTVCLNYLSQLKFSVKDDPELFKIIFKIYVDILDNAMKTETNKIVFDKSKKEKKFKVPTEGLEFKLIHFALTGLKRVLPYVESHNDENNLVDIKEDMQKYVKLLFLIHEHSNCSLTCFQIIGLLNQLSGLMPELNDRIHSTILKTINSLKLISYSHLSLFLSIIKTFLESHVDSLIPIIKALLQACSHFTDSRAKFQVLSSVYESAKMDLVTFQKMVPPSKHSLITKEDIEALNDNSMTLHVSVNTPSLLSSSDYLFELTPLLYDFDPKIAQMALKLSLISKKSLDVVEDKQTKSGPILFLDTFTNRKQKGQNVEDPLLTISSKLRQDVQIEELYLYEFLQHRKQAVIKNDDLELSDAGSDNNSFVNDLELPSDMEEMDVDDPFKENEEEFEDLPLEGSKALPTFMGAEEVEELLQKKKKRKLDVTQF